MADHRSRPQTVEDGTALAEGQVPPRVLNSFTPEICLSLGLHAPMRIHSMESYLFLQQVSWHAGSWMLRKSSTDYKWWSLGQQDRVGFCLYSLFPCTASSQITAQKRKLGVATKPSLCLLHRMAVRVSPWCMYLLPKLQI